MIDPSPLPSPISLAQLPTPIQRLSAASRRLAVEVYVKRDDLTESALSGNKIRKLEYTLAEARRAGARRLVTCGAEQSNHARATALSGAKLGFEVKLLLWRDAAGPITGNLLLDMLAGADVEFLTRREYRDRARLMAEIRDRDHERGVETFLIPEGASDALGSLGYVAAMAEIVQQSGELGLAFDYVVCAAGSGGTYVGLRVGAERSGFEGRIIGIDVCDDVAYFRGEAARILDEMRRRWWPRLRVGPEDCHFVDGFKGPGYGRSSAEDVAELKRMAGEEGLILDPVYTIKAWRGLVGLVESGEIAAGSRVLFLHTGGLIGLFGHADQLV